MQPMINGVNSLMSQVPKKNKKNFLVQNNREKWKQQLIKVKVKYAQTTTTLHEWILNFIKHL